MTSKRERINAANRGFEKSVVSCFYCNEVPNSSFLHWGKFIPENPRIRIAENY